MLCDPGRVTLAPCTSATSSVKWAHAASCLPGLAGRLTESEHTKRQGSGWRPELQGRPCCCLAISPWAIDVPSLYIVLLTMHTGMIITPPSERFPFRETLTHSSGLAHSRHSISTGRDHYLAWTGACLSIYPFFAFTPCTYCALCLVLSISPCLPRPQWAPR